MLVHALVGRFGFEIDENFGDYFCTNYMMDLFSFLFVRVNDTPRMRKGSCYLVEGWKGGNFFSDFLPVVWWI